MGCEGGIGKAIISNCTTQGVGGLEVKAWLFNINQVTIDFNPLLLSQITEIAPVTALSKVLYPVTGVKRLLNAGFERTVASDRADRWKHKINFQGFEFDTASVENFDAIANVGVIVESKDKNDSGDGVLRCFGAKYGMFVGTDTMMANDINGARSIEVASLDESPEPHSQYTVLVAGGYAATKAMIAGLEVA